MSRRPPTRRHAGPASARRRAGTVDRSRTACKALTLRYVVDVDGDPPRCGGSLGGVLRQSQADARHGLAEPVVRGDDGARPRGVRRLGRVRADGLTWWVLAECGFPIRGWGWRWAVRVLVDDGVGVAGIVVTGLGMGFARLVGVPLSAPVPLRGRGRDAATALFSLSVLSVGLSIFAYCFGILATRHRARARRPEPGSGEPASVLRARLRLSSGRSASRPSGRSRTRSSRSTVIAIDMIIATLPLAILLVLMVVQAIDPSVTVDPLLAKSDAVVVRPPGRLPAAVPGGRRLLPPDPELAGRRLVAGHIIAVGWTDRRRSRT